MVGVRATAIQIDLRLGTIFFFGHETSLVAVVRNYGPAMFPLQQAGL